MEMQNIPLLEVKNLVVHYELEESVVEAVNDVSFTIQKGRVLGLVGETGAGKTTIALSLIGLLPVPPSRIHSGEILLNGGNILDQDEKEWRKLRGNRISMIFQDPMTALNPAMSVGSQIAEVIELHQKVSHNDAVEQAKAMLETVGIKAERYHDFPHQLSGGMKQRVIIAIALACKPELLIADEPTTALDVTIQAQVLELMRELQQKLNMGMLMISHDFGVIAEICNDCAVVYAGEIVEIGTLEDVFEHTAHPYTQGLFAAIPKLESKVDRLKVIEGMMSDPTNLPEYCSFYDRCPHHTEICKSSNPSLREVSAGHFVRCFHASQN